MRECLRIYVEASIGICCVITARHRVRYSFRFSRFTCNMYSRHTSALTICIHPIQSASPFSRQMWLKACLQRASLSEQVNCLPQLVWIICHMQQPQNVLRVLSEQWVRGRRRAGVCLLLKSVPYRYCPGFGCEVRNRGVDSGKQYVLLPYLRAITISVTQGAFTRRCPHLSSQLHEINSRLRFWSQFFFFFYKLLITTI